VHNYNKILFLSIIQVCDKVVIFVNYRPGNDKIFCHPRESGDPGNSAMVCHPRESGDPEIGAMVCHPRESGDPEIGAMVCHPRESGDPENKARATRFPPARE